jgi:hypothetical protein
MIGGNSSLTAELKLSEELLQLVGNAPVNESGDGKRYMVAKYVSVSR